jgi:hypothetical protein
MRHFKSSGIPVHRDDGRNQHVPEPPSLKWSDLKYVFFASRRTDMPRKKYKPEEIVAKPRQVDVLVSQGSSMADAIRQIGVSEVACATNAER